MKKSIMLNRIRKNIQDNYTYCGIVHKPTAKQIAFLENKITAQVLEDKDEYRLYYRILKAEKAMLHGEWDSISQYICGYADTGAIVLQIGKHIIPKPIQYKIAVGLYTDKGDMYCEILDIVKSGRSIARMIGTKKFRNACVPKLLSPFIGRGKKISIMRLNLCRGHYGEMLPSGLRNDMSITDKEHSTYIKRLFPPMIL